MFPYVEIVGLEFSTFPFIIIIAFFITGVVYIKSPQYSKAFLLDFMSKIVPVLIGAGVGARIMSAITLLVIWEKPFWYNLLFGGSVFYGGIVGGGLGLAIMCAIKRQPFLEYTDVFVSLIPLGHAIGRLGCYLNGCCYGCRYDGFFSVTYPIEGKLVKVFPTWFVEMTVCVGIFIFFNFVYKTKIRGRRTAIYFMLYSCYRFLIEYVRGDDIRGVLWKLSTSQFISILTLLFGIIVLIYSNKIKVYNYMILKEKRTDEV